MRQKAKISLLFTALIAVVIYSCSKYEDPAPADGSGLFNNKYCNDSRATNYNWGFPGVPDNSACIYPVDSFLGKWSLTDSMFSPNGENIGVALKTLTFTGTEDTARIGLSVTGWCSNNTAIYLVANKYGYAYADTLAEGTPGQFLCGATTDTLSGQLNLYKGGDSTLKGTMEINFMVNDASGTVNHRGTAIKQ